MYWIRYHSSNSNPPDRTCSYYKVYHIIISFVVSFIYLLLVLGFWPSSSWISKWSLPTYCCRLLFAWWICWVGAAIVFKPGQGRSAFLGPSWSTPFVFDGVSSKIVKPLGWGLPSKSVRVIHRSRLGHYVLWTRIRSISFISPWSSLCSRYTNHPLAD